MREWETERFIAGFGTSGIGKSALLQLAVLRSLAKGDLVLLHKSGVNFMFEFSGSQWSVTENVSVMAAIAGDRAKDIVVCYDSRAGFADHFGLAEAFKRVLIVHSPSAHRANTGKVMGLRKRFIDNPTFHELIALGALVAGIDANVARNRIDLYGRSIRYVCDPRLAEAEITEGLADMVKSVVDRLSLGETIATVHCLTLMVRKPDHGHLLVFLSDNIRDRAVSAIAAASIPRLLALANTSDIHGSMRGQIFVNRMHDVMERAGTVAFKTGSGVEKLLTITGVSVTLCVDKKVHSLPEGETLRSGVQYRPPHSNNEAWDALVVDGDTAYLLQMTVATLHPIKHNGIVAEMEFLKENGFDVERGNVRLVFLVPPSVFDAFIMPQAMLDSKKSVCARETSQRWPQEKWCVDKVGNVAFWPAT